MEHFWCHDLRNYIKLMVLEIIMFYFDHYYFEEYMLTRDKLRWC
jgi:hypothetical protein